MVMPRCSLVAVLPWCHAESGGRERAVSPLHAKRGASAGCCFQGGVEVAATLPTGPAGLVDIPLLHCGGEESGVSLQHQCCCSPKNCIGKKRNPGSHKLQQTPGPWFVGGNPGAVRAPCAWECLLHGGAYQVGCLWGVPSALGSMDMFETRYPG